MNNFAEIIHAVNEKNDVYAKAHLDKAIEIQRRINSKNMASLGQYTLRKRARYVVIQSVQPTPLSAEAKAREPSCKECPKKTKARIGVLFLSS